MAEKSKRSLVDHWQSANQILMMLAVGITNGVYGPSILDLAELYFAAPNEVALMNSTRAFGMLFGSCIGSFIYSRMNDQILMMFTWAVYGALTTLVPLLHNLINLHLLGFVAGASIGICHIGSQVRLVTIWAERSASAIQAFHTAYGVGSMIGPFVCAPFLLVRQGDLVIKESQLYIPYAILGGLFLLILLSMVGACYVDPSTIHGAKEIENVKGQSSRRTFEIIIMAVLFIYLVTCVNTEATFSTLLSVYAVGSPALRFSKADAAYLSGIFWTAFTGGRIVSIFTAAFFDLVQLLYISHFLVILASGLLIAFNSSVLWTWVGVGLMGLGTSSMYGAASGHVFQYLYARHFHVSVILIAACVGIAFSGFFVPPLVEAWPMFLQYYIGAGNIFHIVTLLVMLRATRGRQKVHGVDEPEPIKSDA